MTAGLHRDFIRMALDNSLATPGGMRVLGTQVDLGAVDVDTYIVAGSERPHRRLAQRLPRRRSCSAATAGSCCPRAATSRR